MDTPTNPVTADAATQRGALPLRRLHLIGVAGAPDARRAMVRTPGGQIKTVQVGDEIRQGRVVAIDEDAVILSGPTGAQTLRLPALPARAAA